MIGYIYQLQDVMDNFDDGQFMKARNLVHTTIDQNFKIFLIGNGGSAAMAMHMANDLSKLVADGIKRPVKAMCLTSEVSTLTAVANDKDYCYIFQHQLENWAVPGDLVIAYSCSGVSSNILHAVSWAKEHGVKVLSFTGGTSLYNESDAGVFIDSDSCQQIEDMHLILSHLMCLELVEKFNDF
jgi:D-sedoheptulose 7-phosphate isomerase